MSELDRRTIDAVRATREGLPTMGEAVAAMLEHVQRALQAAEDRLDELSGPSFVAWRCDECGRVVAEDTLVDDMLGDDRDYVSWIERRLQDGGGVHEVMCWGADGVPQPMRRVLCRVTADGPPEVQANGGAR